MEAFIVLLDMLFQIPQRYRFSSKSQQRAIRAVIVAVVLDTTKVQIFKQITTSALFTSILQGCFRYHKGTDFQANHNKLTRGSLYSQVVLDTTKVQIFKQITTIVQSERNLYSCFRYHKGTDFQANHNKTLAESFATNVVLDTTKVQIFKQITTHNPIIQRFAMLFQIPQRYRFSSKSQQGLGYSLDPLSCFRYHKGTDFQANHNTLLLVHTVMQLFQIPQRYRFSSKSQRQ